MKPFTLLAAACCAMACLCATATAEKLSVTLSGLNEVPSADPDGSGSGILTIDTATSTLSWSFSYSNIAAPSALHIHTGSAGINGGVLVSLGTAGVPGTLTGSVVTTAANITALLANPSGYYLNIHNAEYSGGAMRSQFARVAASTFPVVMTGANEVAAGDPDGTALGVLTVDPGTNSISWQFAYDKLSTPTGFHIHSGVAGTNGGVLVALSATSTCALGTLVNTVSGVTNAAIDAILAAPNAHYLNIHNSVYAGGAVRQQIAVPPTCQGDLNNDGVVNGGDLGALLSRWGLCM